MICEIVTPSCSHWCSCSSAVYAISLDTWFDPNDFLTLLIASRTAPGVIAELFPLTTGVANSTGYVERFRFSHVPVVAFVW